MNWFQYCGFVPLKECVGKEISRVEEISDYSGDETATITMVLFADGSRSAIDGGDDIFFRNVALDADRIQESEILPIEQYNAWRQELQDNNKLRQQEWKRVIYEELKAEFEPGGK